MKIILAVLFFIHGFAHIVGFIVPFKLAELDEMPYSTTVFFNRIDMGSIGIRILGLVWLFLAILFSAAGAGLLFKVTWWHNLAVSASLISLMLCIIGLPEAKIGIPVNIAILVFLCLNLKTFWV